MNVPAGYKATEVGVIPEDWGVTTIGDEYDVQLGKMLDAERNRGVPKSYVGNRAVRWGSIDISELGTVPMSPSDITRYRLKAGDILACEGGEVGRSAIWNDELPECYYQKALHRLRPRSDFNSRFLIELLYRASLIGGFTNFVSQTSIAHLTKEKFQALPIPRPSKEEQTAIAEALSDIDEAIAGQEAVIAKKRALKTATMQALLSGTRRLPGFSGKWEVKALGDIATAVGGATPSTTDSAYWDGGIPWCTPTDITAEPSNVLCQTSRTISAAGLAASATKLLPAGSLLLCTRASVGEIKIAGVPMCTNQGFKGLLCNADNSNIFLFYLLTTMTDVLRERSSGSTFLEISKKDLISIEMATPALDEQQAIAAILSDIDDDIAGSDAKLAKLHHLKTGMMQQLLTGKIRLV